MKEGGKVRGVVTSLLAPLLPSSFRSFQKVFFECVFVRITYIYISQIVVGSSVLCIGLWMVVIHFAFVKERKNNIVPHVQSHTYTHCYYNFYSNFNCWEDNRKRDHLNRYLLCLYLFSSRLDHLACQSHCSK